MTNKIIRRILDAITFRFRQLGKESNPLLNYLGHLICKIYMEQACKRQLSEPAEDQAEPNPKHVKTSNTYDPKFTNLTHGKGKPIPNGVINQLTEEDVALIKDVKTSCLDLEKVQAAIKLRMKHRLTIRLPEDYEDSTYYIENGLRKVYPYPYLYQAYTKRRWVGSKFRDVLKNEFRDISDDQLKKRFTMNKIIINGSVAEYEHVLKDNDFITNFNHRHELPVLATPIKVIYKDKDTLVVDKPPSVPIHPCGRYRHNSIIHILKKQYNYDQVKVVHRLDRLVSGVLIIALNSGRANLLETMIKNRNVQKEYVCRVIGEFPLGSDSEDGEITVDQPLGIVPGKIGIAVAVPEGKPSMTKFKRLNFNGRTSAVLCKPMTGRMHQIRVHLQYLGHPIVNDTLYNCASFGPERGKGGRYGKSLSQLSSDIIAKHRASTWLVTEDTDMIDIEEPDGSKSDQLSHEDRMKTVDFIDEDERAETLAALAHLFTDESLKDLETRYMYDPKKNIEDPNCRDCHQKFHDPPLRSLYLYLHALKYTGEGWSYQSDMPIWARESWNY